MNKEERKLLDSNDLKQFKKIHNNKYSPVYEEYAKKLHINDKLPRGKYFKKMIEIVELYNYINKALGISDMFINDVWDVKLKKLSDHFMANCGLSYEIYQQKFSKSVDELVINLNDDDKKIVIDLARELFDYLSADEIEKQITENEKDGFCQHGLDFDCCPLGCGEF